MSIKKIHIHDKNNINEVLFSWYIVSFMILKPINTLIPSLSTLVLFLNTLITLSISLVNNKLKFNIKNVKAIIFIIIIWGINSIYLILNYNSYSLVYLYNFVIYLGVPIFLFSYIKKLDNVLLYYCRWGVVAFFIYFFEPFTNYKMTMDYMGFGFNGMLPAYIGIHTLRTVFKKRKLIILEIICMIQILLFANKGALISAIVYICLISVFCKKLNIKKIIRYFIIIIIFIFLLSLATDILISIQKFLNNNGISSYSINTLVSFFKDGKNTSLDSRNILWDNARSLYYINPILGLGVGAYESIYGIYTHNIILDIFIFYGVLGITIFTILIIRSLYVILYSDKKEKIFGIIVFSLSFPTLLLSINLYLSWSFWILMSFGFLMKKRIKEKK